MTARLFTPAQANRTLPLVRRIVADILASGRELRTVAAERGSDNRERLETLGNEMRGWMEELRQIGCDYKDWSFDAGLVDFPAEIDGRPVLLCWRSDEARVEWYHDFVSGFAGRTRIPAELLTEEAGEELGAARG